uniref:RNase H type-1 domain-containing protein n=1 Tax=Fagus sylvatica TaxID=28930 RepID=A0A2N9GU29_FAGSY
MPNSWDLNHLSATEYALEYLEAISEPQSAPHVSTCTWTPPSDPIVFKVNVASIIFKEQRAMGLGIVVGNSLGDFMAASSEKLKEDGDLLLLSALSMLNTMKFQTSIGFYKVEIECNNALLVSLLNSDKSYALETGRILKDIRELMFLFSLISFKSVAKSCNCVAFALASFSKEKDEQIVWLEDCPPFLFPIVNLDS